MIIDSATKTPITANATWLALTLLPFFSFDLGGGPFFFFCAIRYILVASYNP